MSSGIKTLYKIDNAIAKARGTVGEAARLPGRAANALAELNRKQVLAYENIAKLRMALVEDGKGGELGYVDRQVGKLLKSHALAEAKLVKKVDASLDKITKLEANRRAQEIEVANAVDAYDKAAQACQKKLVTDPHYIDLLLAVETSEAITERAEAKQSLAETEVKDKGAPYRNDVYFQYLQKRAYGTKHAKGWLLTKALDGWIARRGKYRDAAVNYQRLKDIPGRLAAHVTSLEGREDTARTDLKNMEVKTLAKQGVTTLKNASLASQKKLDAIDAKLQHNEEAHQKLRTEHAQISGGESAPYREAISLLVGALQQKNLPDLRRLAAQTISNDDDRAIGKLMELSRHAKDLEADQSQARNLLAKYQARLSELETLRRKFKGRRYDAPSSDFPSSNLIGTLLGQLVAGLVSGNDVWRQIKRAQRTVRRHSDVDFGGIDWGEAMRLPRNSGGFGGGGWGGGKPRRRRQSRPRMPRTRMPRAPRIRLPRGGGGGFHTKGGF